MGSENAKTPQGIVSKPSRHSVQDTLSNLESTVRSRGLTVFRVIDHSGEAARVGLKMRESKLLLFGNPKLGGPLMIASPLLGLDLPLKALVWKDDKENVWVSYNSVPYLASRYSISDDLIKNISGIDAVIDAALSS